MFTTINAKEKDKNCSSPVTLLEDFYRDSNISENIAMESWEFTEKNPTLKSKEFSCGEELKKLLKSLTIHLMNITFSEKWTSEFQVTDN